MKENEIRGNVPHYEEDMCDLTPGKICDNCEKCLGLDRDYLTVRVDKIRPDLRAGSKKIWRVKRDEDAE